jgi:lipoyl-dependent peroxiredoxin
MKTPAYTAHGRVDGGRNGHGCTDDGKLDLALRMPPELGGDGAGSNPEQLFAVGYAACFATVLTALGRREDLEADDVTIASSVHLIPVGDGTFTLGVELDISLPLIAEHRRAAALAQRAHRICPYSRATQGNVETTLRVNGTVL